MGLGEILKNGMLIFLPWDLLKLAGAVLLAGLLLPAVKRLEQHPHF